MMDSQTITSSVPATRSRHSWRPVLVMAALAQVLLNVVLMAINGRVVPPLIAISVFLIAGLVVLVSRPRAGAAVVGTVSLLHLAAGGRFLAGGLLHPESFWDFWLGWSTILTVALCVYVSIALWRQRDHTPTRARSVSIGTGALIVALAIAGSLATITSESDTAREGDVAVVAQNVEFEPTEVRAESGDVAVFVENADPFRHTFSIDELDVDLELPGSKAARVEFIAEPGTYTFFCAVRGHEDMKGELVIR